MDCVIDTRTWWVMSIVSTTSLHQNLKDSLAIHASYKYLMSFELITSCFFDEFSFVPTTSLHQNLKDSLAIQASYMYLMSFELTTSPFSKNLKGEEVPI